MPALRLAPLIGLLLALAVIAPGSAGAAVLVGEVTDPADSPGSPGQDIAKISSSYDPDTGTWTEVIRFHGPLTTAGKAMFYSSLSACGSGSPGSPAPPIPSPASMQTWTDPADSSLGAFVSGLVDGVPTWRPSPEAAAKQVSDDRRTLTLSLTDPLLMRRDVCFLSPFRLSSHGMVYDRVAGIELKPESQPGDGLAPDSVAPTATIARTLVVPDRGRPRLTVSRISEPVHGTVVVRRRRGGRVLGRGRFRTYAAKRTARVPLRLADGIRRELERRGRLLVTVHVALSDDVGNSAAIARGGVLRPTARAAGSARRAQTAL